MSDFNEKLGKHQKLEREELEIDDDLKRIKSFLDRDNDNGDLRAARGKEGHNKEMIFVKFAGTGCYLSEKIFREELEKRKAHIEKRKGDIKKEKEAL